MEYVRRVIVAVALCGLAGAPARAQQNDLCASLRNAWQAGKREAAALRGLTMAGTRRCNFSDGDLRCTWRLGDHDEARRTYERFQGIVIPCFAPLGLTPVHVNHNGVETTSLRAPGSDPNVAIFLPGGSTVTIAVITP